MALTIGQLATISYPAVLADKKKPENQWAENSLLDALEKMGMLERRNLGSTIDVPLDYRRNPGTDFLATDLTPTSLAKTEVMTTASFAVAELTVPVVWSKKDDAQTPSENAKIAFTTALLENAIQSHDDALEEALFSTSTDGFLGMSTIIPASGQGTVGGIDSGTETMWRNQADTYLADGSDMEAVLTTLWNSASKSTGAVARPKLLVSGSSANSLFESTQVGFQRFNNVSKADAGFTSIAFKTAPFIFSQYGDDEVYGLSKAFRLVVSKGYFRDKGETRELDDANGYVFKLYSALQSITNAKSRLFRASSV